MSMQQRYIPVPRGLWNLNNTGMVYNISMNYGNSANASMDVSLALQQQSTVLGSYILYIFLALTVLIIVATAILYMSSGYRGTVAKIIFSRGNVYGNVPAISYMYTGIKAILRKYYVKLREKVQCHWCTPREIVFKLGAYHRFADVYEDVVYGCKERQDIRIVLDEVSRIDESK